MTKDEKELIQAKFSRIHATIKANHDLQMVELKHIKDYQIKQNGRLDKLEDETKIVRFFERRPVILILVLLGIIALLGIYDLTEFIKIAK